MDIVDNVLAYPNETRDIFAIWRLLCTLRDGRYDLAIHLVASRGLIKSARDALFFKLCGIRRTVGVPWRKRDRECMLNGGSVRYEWEAERLARRISELGVVNLSDDTLWDLRLSKAETDEADLLLGDGWMARPIIAASVGTKVDANHWTLENWKRLFAMLNLSVAPNTGLVILGSEDESAEAEGCLAEWQGARRNLCGQTSPRVAAAVLRMAKVFVGHDSGLIHLAGAIGTPCIGIYSARNPPGQWFPRGSKNRIFYRQTKCFGCRLDRCLAERKRCILGISPNEVAVACCAFINSNHLAEPLED
ncbi:MAG TPA: glycosyltransferase family 9 protein [Tepidisphaeraceae bacterium]|nr:glycosyltransferase family 9 protein [Tepidisphaeraceae bacterium]